MNKFEDGRYDISSDDYHASEGISKTQLDVFAVSPRHYWLRYMKPDRMEQKDRDALIIGAASHCAVLEPDVFESAYVAVPDDAPKKPSITQLNAKKPSPETVDAIQWWYEFNSFHAHRIVLTKAQFKECLELRDCVHSDPSAAALLSDGEAEKSYFATDPETGMMRRCRPDFLTSGGIFIDLKFVRDASPWGFGKSCAVHRYDVQAAYYPDTVALLYGKEKDATFAFIAVEKNEFGPVCAIYYADAEMIAAGRRKYMKELRDMRDCFAANKWLGYTTTPQPVMFPAYAL